MIVVAGVERSEPPAPSAKSGAFFMPSPDLTAARARISAAYDPSVLENAGTKLMGTIADHFRRVESRDSKVLNWNEPNTLIAQARRFLSKSPLHFREGPGEGSASSSTTSSNDIAAG